MTFTYDLESVNDVTRVRFHVGDTNADVAVLSDEEIGFAISEAGGWKPAVIWCLDLVMQKMLADSGLKLDWLEVDAVDAVKEIEKIKRNKRRELGIADGGRGGVSSVARHVSRFDSPGVEDDSV